MLLYLNIVPVFVGAFVALGGLAAILFKGLNNASVVIALVAGLIFTAIPFIIKANVTKDGFSLETIASASTSLSDGLAANTAAISEIKVALGKLQSLIDSLPQRDGLTGSSSPVQNLQNFKAQFNKSLSEIDDQVRISRGYSNSAKSNLDVIQKSIK